MAYTYDYPRPMVTADILILKFETGQMRLLLIRRKNPPFAGGWALPGGFLEMDERPEESAARELREETGLSGVPLFPLGSAGAPDRDPRGRTISLLHGGILTRPFPEAKAGDDAGDLQWFPLNELPELAFDHEPLIRAAREELKFRSVWRLWILLFLPAEFGRGELESCCRELLGRAEYAGSLLQRALRAGWIRRTDNGNFLKRRKAQEILAQDFNSLGTLLRG